MSDRNYWTALRQRKISRRTMLGASAKAGVGAAGLVLVGCGDDDEPDAGAAAAERAATAAEEAAAAAIAAGEARAAETEAAAEAAAAAADAAGEASDAAAQAAAAAADAAALAAEAAESEDAANAAAAAEAAAAAAADAAAAASAAGDQAAAAVAAAASEAAEAAAQAARDAAAAVEAGTATAAAAQAAIDEAAEAAAAAAAAAGEASAAAGQAAATAQETAEAAAETAAAAVAAAEEAAAAAQEAAESAAMAMEEAQAEEQAVARSGGVYRRANTNAPNFARLGFGSAGNNNGFNQDFSIYERLARVSATTLEPDPSGGVNLFRVTDADFTIEPVLANGWERPDDTTWVFDVRTDPVWHTGRPFDIDDVHYMFESIRDPNAGGGQSNPFRMSANLDVGEVMDASTYRLTLTQPTGYIETLLEQTNIVDRETYDDRETDAIIVGTGPYTFENYDPNRGWDQLPHAQFASVNNHPLFSGGAPQFDKIEHTIYADSAVMATAFEAGELDSHQGLPIGLPEAEERLLWNEDFYADAGWSASGQNTRFRADLEPFRNKLARQAVLMLVDGPRVQQDFAGKFDTAARMHWQPGTVPYAEGNGAALDPHPMGVDPEAARAEAGRLFEAAGFTGGETLKIDTFPTRLYAPALAQLLQQELSAFDINTEINPREQSELIKLLVTGTFEHMLIGFGSHIRPGSPAVTVLFANGYDGNVNAPVDENVPLHERPGISDEPEWLDMIEQARNGTWTDWTAWNEKYLDVAWSNVLIRQSGVQFRANRLDFSGGIDANRYPYAPGARFAT